MRKQHMLGILIIVLFSFTFCGNESTESSPERPADLFNQQEEVGSAAVQYEPTVFIPDVDMFAHFEDLLSLFPASTMQTTNVAHGGTLNVGLVRILQTDSAAGFQGLFHGTFAFTSSQDAFVGRIMAPSLLPFDETGRIILGDNHQGPVIVEFDFETYTKTLTIRDGVYLFWSDGVPLTLDNLVVIYYYWGRMPMALGPMDYWTHVRGLHEFRDREADHISGLMLSDEGRSLTIQYDIFLPEMMYCTQTVFPVARHRILFYFDNNELDIAAFNVEGFRASFIGYGPFLLYEHVLGSDTVTLIANEFYWRGRPNLDKIVLHSVTPEDAVTMLLNGELDIVDIRDIDIDALANDDDINFLSVISNQQAMLYFNLGAMVDLTAGRHAGLPEHRPRTDEHPMMDPVFRHAISLAIDNQAIVDLLGHGLAAPATSILHPYNALSFIDPGLPSTAMLHVDAANALLDQLGLRWGDEGYRLNAYLEPLYINIAIPRMQAWDALFEILQGNMRDIGIELRPFSMLPGGSLMYQNVILTQSRNNNANHPMHMFLIFDEVPEISLPAWDATAPWGYSVNNLGGFNNDAANQIFNELNAVQLRSDDELRTLYQNWDQLFQAYVPAIPLFWQLDIQAVNRNVINYTRTRGVHHNTALQWHRIGFIAD